MCYCNAPGICPISTICISSVTSQLPLSGFFLIPTECFVSSHDRHATHSCGRSLRCSRCLSSYTGRPSRTECRRRRVHSDWENTCNEAKCHYILRNVFLDTSPKRAASSTSQTAKEDRHHSLLMSLTHQLGLFY